MRWWLILLVFAFGLMCLIVPLAILGFVEHRHSGRFEGRTRLPSLPPTAPGDDWLAALPVRVGTAEHRPRERGGCTCRAVAFAEQIGDRPVTLSVSPSSFAASHGATWRTGLGHLRGIITLQQAYGLLSRSHFSMSVDNLPIPSGWRHRLRLVFADHSSVVLTAGGRHNARLFVETFTRLHDNVELRILGTLAGRGPVAVHTLADEVNLREPTLQSHLGKLAGEGGVRLGPDGAELTGSGRELLAMRVRYVATVTRFVQVDVTRADVRGG